MLSAGLDSMYEDEMYNIEMILDSTDPFDLARFIHENQWIVAYIKKAELHFKREFLGIASSYSFRIWYDPDPVLFIYANIKCRINDSVIINDAMERLGRFDDDWYLNQPGECTSLVNFNVSFIQEK